MWITNQEKPTVTNPTKPPEPTESNDETLKMALYAEWGRRKTEQLGTIIEMVGMENVFIASCDRGLKTIRSIVDFNNVCEVDNWAGMQKAYAAAKQRGFINNPSKWIFGDGMTSVLLEHTNSLFSGTERVHDLKARHQQIDDNDIPFSRYISPTGGVDGRAIYGRVGRDITRLFQTWRGLGTNLIFTFLEEMVGRNDKNEKSFPFGPAIPGEIGYRAAMSTFDYVLRLWYDADGKLTAGTKATPRMEARTREDKRTGLDIPPVITDFNLANFVKLVTGQTTSTNPTKETTHA
jgi:hypothetical protein